MRNKLIVFYLILCPIRIFSQEQVTIENIQTLNIPNVNIMKCGDSIVGYYALFEQKPEKKIKNHIYQLNVYDQFLVLKFKHVFEMKEGVHPIEVSFNGSHLCLVTFKLKEKMLHYRVYNLQGNLDGDFSITPSEAEMEQYKYWLTSPHYTSAYLVPIPLKGFVRFGYSSEKGAHLTLEAFNNKGLNLWKSSFSSGFEKLQDCVHFANCDNKNFITYISSKKGGIGTDFYSWLEIRDAETGSVKFSSNLFQKENYVPFGFMNDKTGYIVYGLYGGKNYNGFDADKKGMYFQKIDFSGKILQETKLDWNKEIAAKMTNAPEELKTLTKNSTFFMHALTSNANSEYLLITEHLRETTRISSMPGGMPSRAAYEFSNENIFLFRFDTSFVFQSATEIKKKPHDARENQSVLFAGESPPLLVPELRNWVMFDFLKKNDQTLYFLDIDELNFLKDYCSFKICKYNYSEQNTQAISSPQVTRARKFKVLEAPDDGFVLVEYFHKDKLAITRIH